VADVYDAFRSKRPYKLPWPHEKAVEEISRSSGTHFDPLVVDAFMRRKDELRDISERMMD
jgi:putative two-component system response regulator